MQGGTVAQSVEHATENRGVAGSIPAGPTQSPIPIYRDRAFLFLRDASVISSAY